MIAALQAEEFKNDFSSLQKSDQTIAKKLIDEILQDPLRTSEVMKADYRGLRKRRKGRIRILFAYCKDCRQRNDEATRGCPDCSTMSDETIIFFYVGLRGILY